MLSGHVFVLVVSVHVVSNLVCFSSGAGLGAAGLAGKPGGVCGDHLAYALFITETMTFLFILFLLVIFVLCVGAGVLGSRGYAGKPGKAGGKQEVRVPENRLIWKLSLMNFCA